MRLAFVLASVAAALAASAIPARAQAPEKLPPHRVAADSVYLQELGAVYADPAPLLAAAVHKGVPYVGGPQGLFTLEQGEPVPGASECLWRAPKRVEGFSGPVERLVAAAGALWAISEGRLHRFDGAWKRIGEEIAADVCEHLGQAIVASGDRLLRVEGDALAPLRNGKAQAPIARLASHAESIYCVLPGGGIAIHAGDHFERRHPALDWGQLPSKNVRDLRSVGSRAIFATDRGLGVLRGMTMHVIAGGDGLCHEETTCVAEGFGGDLWIGTERGAIRWTGDDFHFFGASRWLPGPKVNAIAAGERAVFVATDAGLGVIEYAPYTLAKKAAHYERWTAEWGHKRLGFVHKLEWNGAEWVREVSDNDCGWSAEWLAAMSFKFAATGDAAAREEAAETFKTLKWAEEITGIDGFPARSIWAVGEKGHKAQHGSGGLPAEWHATADGHWEWKGDTSSDETDAHFYAVSIFHDIAANDAEKALAREHLGRIAAHIRREGWVLRDVDGKPTRWARWDPEYLQRPYGFYARGLNGMEALSYMRTAAALTGDPQFDEGTRELVRFGYAREVLKQKLTFPPDDVTQFDDRLAFYAYYPLLKYERDPAARSTYVRSLERSWEIERIERNPWFNFVYGALTGNDCEADEAAASLREWPLDLVDHAYSNSSRRDLAVRAGYKNHTGHERRVLPVRERAPGRWSDDPFEQDGGGGRQITDPSAWLHAYWMGRHFGFIGAPESSDPALTTVAPRSLNLGAAPYAGAPRPPLKSEAKP